MVPLRASWVLSLALAIGTLVLVVPSASAECAPDDTACQTQEWLEGTQAWLDYCLHQKPPSLGDTWTCFVNPAP